MKTHDLNLPSDTKHTSLMPLLFIGHGSPMNAIEQNAFSKAWVETGKTIPVPSAILCFSAHWETYGTFVTSMDHPRTIHDFYGFPEELFRVQYPAPGNPSLANEIRRKVSPEKIESDTQWGLDHGSWSMLKHLYPEAGIPIVQMSLDHMKTPAEHFRLAKQLSFLRRKGVLIIGSGNIVHNLRLIDWKQAKQGYPWASEANEIIKRMILEGNNDQLINYTSLGKEVQSAIPTPEHFIPLLYILSLREENEQVSFFNDSLIYGSLAMTSIKIF